VVYYSGKDVSIYVKIWSVITWVLNFGLALLVPEDVYQTLQGQHDLKINKHLGMHYLLLYWSVYILTWTIIPILQEWEDAGDF
jgi:intergrase/recombinase